MLMELHLSSCLQMDIRHDSPEAKLVVGMKGRLSALKPAKRLCVRVEDDEDGPAAAMSALSTGASCLAALVMLCFDMMCETQDCFENAAR